MKGTSDMKLNTIINTLGTDRQCREYLTAIRWKYGFVCPRCKCPEAWKTYETKFKCKKCGYKMSVTSGTVFQDSHIPLNKWFLAIWFLAESGKKISADMLQKELELGSNRTSQKLVKHINNARHKVQIEKYKIQPAEKLKYNVEICVDPIPFMRNRVYIISAVEKIGYQTGKIRIIRTDNSKQQIADFIKDNVELYDSVKTDLCDKEKEIGIVSKIVLPNNIRRDYNQLIKSPLYGYAATNKIRTDFIGWINRKPNGSFDQYCDEYCAAHNAKFISVSFEELLENLLK